MVAATTVRDAVRSDLAARLSRHFLLALAERGGPVFAGASGYGSVQAPFSHLDASPTLTVQVKTLPQLRVHFPAEHTFGY